MLSSSSDKNLMQVILMLEFLPVELVISNVIEAFHISDKKSYRLTQLLLDIKRVWYYIFSISNSNLEEIIRKSLT